MQLEWESFEKLQMFSPSSFLKPLEYYVLQEMRNDSSNNTEEDDKDEEEEEDDYDDEEEEDYYDEDMERELQTRFTEYDQYEAKEGTSSMGKLEGKTKGWARVGASTKD